uniref:Apple domain-containing protein n=1 Tax=Aureoumbra lagunensis TaxID=44058 RepID=A0A7S3JVD5_9STRA|mmetsp:Transcript_20830/g.31896  ORF Transcript_20830/g.31896 Transcript_20830/m.31896 type:complete len:383 (-) Transcript_20830:22-1170(-)
MIKHTKVLDEKDVIEVEHCLTEGICAEKYNNCKNETRCGAIIQSIGISLRERQQLPYLPHNRAMRLLEKCANENCFLRGCTSKVIDDSVLHHGCSSSSKAICYIANDLVQTENAEACRERCLKHAPPLYPESCAAWSWIKTPRIDDPNIRNTCFLIENHKLGKPTRRRKGHVASGFCSGGPKADDGLDDDACNLMSNDIMALRAWLKIKRSISLPESTLFDLFHYMKLAGGMCPNDADFDDALTTALKSSSGSSKKKSNFSYLDSLLTFIIDAFEILFDLFHKINPAIIIPLLIPLIAKLRSTFPNLANILSPFLEHIEKQHHQSSKKNSDERQKKSRKDVSSSASTNNHRESSSKSSVVVKHEHEEDDDDREEEDCYTIST